MSTPASKAEEKIKLEEDHPAFELIGEMRGVAQKIKELGDEVISLERQLGEARVPADEAEYAIRNQEEAVEARDRLTTLLDSFRLELIDRADLLREVFGRAE